VSKHKILVRGLVLIALLVFAFVVVSLPTVAPPVMSVVAAEPAGIFDDSGEMRMVTLRTSNKRQSKTTHGYLYVEQTPAPIEGKVANHWLVIEGSKGSIGLLSLFPERHSDTLLVVPATAVALRVSVKYTGPEAVRGQLAWLAAGLPAGLRVRLPYKFWRWVGDNGPSKNWSTVQIEVPIAGSFAH
jgi:hypothetical protein